MKRINIHHFPQNLFQEQQYCHYPYHSFHYRHSHYGTTGSSHHSPLHMDHPHRNLLSPRASQTLKTMRRLSHLNDQLTVPVTATIEINELGTTSSAEEQTSSLSSTPQPIQVPTNIRSLSTNDDDQLLTNFLTNYLNRDGILVLFILQMNTNEVITSEIVAALFELFKTNQTRN